MNAKPQLVEGGIVISETNEKLNDPILSLMVPGMRNHTLLPVLVTLSDLSSRGICERYGPGTVYLVRNMDLLESLVAPCVRGKGLGLPPEDLTMTL